MKLSFFLIISLFFVKELFCADSEQKLKIEENKEEEIRISKCKEITKKILKVIAPKAFFKACSWRVIGTVITYVVTYAMTGDAKLSLQISGVETGAKIIAYYTHERLWDVDYKVCAAGCKKKCCQTESND